MKFFANLKCSSAGSATAEDPSAQIVSLEQIPLQRLLSQSPSWSREVSGQKMPMPDSSELLRLADQILQCWDKGKAGFPEQAFRQNSARSNAHWFVLQQDSALRRQIWFLIAFAYSLSRFFPPSTSDQPLYTSQFVCLRSVVRASERKFWKKTNTHTYAATSRTISHFTIKKKSRIMLQKMAF